MQIFMERYFLYFAYNGKNYCGWQIQPNGISVQAKMEESLSLLLRTPIRITGGGRTDAGVHATQMVAHFDSPKNRRETVGLTDKLNRILPADMRVIAIVPVKANAHARFDALSRTYRYFITHEKNPFYHELLYRQVHPLDYDLMNEASQILLEYTDFTSFSKLHTQVKTNNCQIIKAVWTRETEEVSIFTIQADRFLRNMVRAIVGTLLEVGKGKLSLEGFRQVIECKDRGKAGTSVPAHALFLTHIEYPSELFENESNESNEKNTHTVD